LCPAGHLPHLGGDRMPLPLSPIFNGCRQAGTRKLPISPLVGEMSGRTEGALSRHQKSPWQTTPYVRRLPT
ncbi:MAG: endonuclease domain-containing protein, partial [Mesorhizobium sp.]